MPAFLRPFVPYHVSAGQDKLIKYVIVNTTSPNATAWLFVGASYLRA